MSDLRLDRISKSYGDVEVLRNVSIDLNDGEFLVIVGPSGCGKSTLLRTIAGLENITAGEMFIGNKQVNDLTPAQRGIAMVFQSYALYPHMTVYKNMAFGLKMRRKGKQEIEEKIHKAAKILQLDELLQRRPGQLSGGQRQRVAIGRAIVRDPNLFLFDEPLSNLDAALRVQTRIEIAKLHENLQATIVYVTHDQVEAMTLANKIVVMNQGRVEQVGTPMDLYHQPQNRFVAGFIGSPSMNFIDARVAVTDNKVKLVLADGSNLALSNRPENCHDGQSVTVGLRPEHLMENGAEQAGTLQGSVYFVEQLGDVSHVFVRLAEGTEITVRTEGNSRYKAGDDADIGMALDKLHVFDETGRNLTLNQAPVS